MWFQGIVYRLLVPARTDAYGAWVREIVADPVRSGPRGWGLLAVATAAMGIGVVLPLLVPYDLAPRVSLPASAIAAGVIAFRLVAPLFYRLPALLAALLGCGALGTACCGVVGLAWVALAEEGEAPPERVLEAVCRPTFFVDERPVEAGTAFVVATPELRLVSAMHLFGPDYGLPEPIRWTDLPERVRSVRCAAMASRSVWPAGPALAVPGAAPLSEVGVGRDLSAFPLFDGPDGLRLSATDPREGERVWLVARLDHLAPNRLLHRATVVENAASGLLYAFDDPGLTLRGTSGAPVVDVHGDVVGVNVGGGKPGGWLVGVAVPASALRSALADAR